MGDSIGHDGIIESIDGDEISVKILQISSCASCQAKSLCHISESKEKVIEVSVPKSSMYHVGQKVTVVGTSSQGLRAILLAFVIPLIILLTTLFICIGITGDEGLAALLSLLALVPYYIVLLLCKKRLKMFFQFSIID